MLLLATVVAAVVAGPALASAKLADVDVTDVELKVNAKGEALVTYRRANGQPRRLLAWGAVNAAHPSPTTPQVRFQFDYAGGWGKYRKPVWRTFRNACAAYDGPPLVYLVAACKAPDGSYWALQRWQRLQPIRGFSAFKPAHMKHELHLSHWTGPTALLEVSPNWAFAGSWEGLFGRLTYRGVPVHGFRTPSAKRNDDHARFFYIDTLNSAYGRGWKRDAAVVTRSGSGAFCFTFVPLRPPASYPSNELRPAGNGERHRVTVMGPGVTPVLQWEGPALGRYDPVRDQAFNRLFDQFLAGDRGCAPER
jgi:hypothetical protein